MSAEYIFNERMSDGRTLLARSLILELSDMSKTLVKTKASLDAGIATPSTMLDDITYRPVVDADVEPIIILAARGNECSLLKVLERVNDSQVKMTHDGDTALIASTRHSTLR